MSTPQHCPSPRELADLELLLSGALAPQSTFDPDGPVTIVLPEHISDDDDIELVDPEGFPLARLTADASLIALGAPSYGPFRRLQRSPDQVRATWPEALTVPVAGALTEPDLEAIEDLRGDRPVLLLALTGPGTPDGLTPVGLVRATLAAAALIGEAYVVTVPLGSHDDADLDHELGQIVVGNYAPGQVLAPRGRGNVPDEIQAVIDTDRPEEPGLVVFFTGLSGSGKSTLARALHDHLLERGARTVTSLDGDVVRRNLSAGLGFSAADRETNIRRIGWVAAEIARHGGVAICSPIAPFAATRESVRRTVEAAGGDFVLIHVATPLEECERRDRKGLYAKARAGEISEFTGISSPYEAPANADLRLDTTGRSIEDCLDEVLVALQMHESE